MLAYELYLKNRDSTANVVQFQKPVKKLFVNKGKITIDSTTLDEFGSEISEKYRVLQEGMTMPLNTSDVSLLNLPDFRTSTGQPKPYVEIDGMLKVTKSISTFSLAMGGRTKPDNLKTWILASYDNINDKISISARKGIRLRLDKWNYFISGKNLYEKYVESGIIKKDGFFSSILFREIANHFFKYAKKMAIKPERILRIPFTVYILPSPSTVEFRDRSKVNNSKTFIDCFGNSVTSFACNSTRNAKFLSYDDKAFTVNCKTQESFYQNLGIGSESLEKISLPSDQIFRIAGFSWMFSSIEDPHYRFKETNKGIFSQLYENYKRIRSKGETRSEWAMLKVTCFRIQKSKLEILIDENLTMDRMNRLFSWCDAKSIPALCFEELIERTDKKELWNNYIYAIRSFISEVTVPKNYLISVFENIMNRKLHDWIKRETKEVLDFFKRTDFCLKALSVRGSGIMDTNHSEKFAYNIGKVARTYIEFKNKSSDNSHSLKDILTYTKYDREKLRFVMSRIGLGVNISKANQNDIELLNNKISSLQPEQEIPDSEAHNDYSYFFYKGYFEGASKS